MTLLFRKPNACPTALVLALCAAFTPLQAQADAAVYSLSLGVGGFDGSGADRSLFDQYSGLRQGRTGVGLLGADYFRSNADSGASTQFYATNLLLDTRELGFWWKKPGDWKFSANYGELVHRGPEIVNSGLLGAGSTAPQVSPLLNGAGSGSALDLNVKRTGLGIEFAKVISQRLQLDVSLKSENKQGARLFGIGMNCPSMVALTCGGTTSTETGWATLMLPEPINANHSQIETRLTYGGDKLRLSAGYYGSFYRNLNSSLTPGVGASLYNPVGALLPLSSGLQSILSQPIALAPDNEAQQLDLSGSYAFTRSTRLNFKLGYTLAQQQQDFAASGFTSAPAGVANLGGKLVTTLAQIGVTSRPLPKLTLQATAHYEDRDDQTPIALYNVEGSATYTNRQLPSIKARGKLQANYQFTSDYRGTLGVDAESIDRGVFTATSAVAGISALRRKTDETSVRAELRRRMSETFSGALSLESSQRNGSAWLRNNSGLGVTAVPDPSAASSGFSTGIFMPTLADRRRDKIKLRTEWQPTEELSLQMVAEGGKDKFSAPSSYGLRSTAMSSISLDWNYALSSKWNLNGFVSQSRQQLDQARPAGTVLAFDNTSNTFGLGVTGKPMSNLELGGTLSLIEDLSTHVQTLDASAALADAALLAATGGLPDIAFRQAQLKLFGKYKLDKKSTLQVNLIHQRSSWNDWAWVFNGTPYVYSDGTTVSNKPVQNVSFVGVTYVRSWP